MCVSICIYILGGRRARRRRRAPRRRSQRGRCSPGRRRPPRRRTWSRRGPRATAPPQPGHTHTLLYSACVVRRETGHTHKHTTRTTPHK